MMDALKRIYTVRLNQRMNILDLRGVEDGSEIETKTEAPSRH